MTNRLGTVRKENMINKTIEVLINYQYQNIDSSIGQANYAIHNSIIMSCVIMVLSGRAIFYKLLQK